MLKLYCQKLYSPAGGREKCSLRMTVPYTEEELGLKHDECDAESDIGHVFSCFHTKTFRNEKVCQQKDEAQTLCETDPIAKRKWKYYLSRIVKS